mmetsp:Transcript_4813/g.21476  ORF Transcript_4813/g.21476 Transcript_4813/m.21476 type:complete len:222 (+) Transcript_4813:462-1127(+)
MSCAVGLIFRTMFWMFRKLYACAKRSSVVPSGPSSVTSRRSRFLARGILYSRAPRTSIPKSFAAAYLKTCSRYPPEPPPPSFESQPHTHSSFASAPEAATEASASTAASTSTSMSISASSPGAPAPEELGLGLRPVPNDASQPSSGAGGTLASAAAPSLAPAASVEYPSLSFTAIPNAPARSSATSPVVRTQSTSGGPSPPSPTPSGSPRKSPRLASNFLS